jgi:hypothetical protein
LEGCIVLGCLFGEFPDFGGIFWVCDYFGGVKWGEVDKSGANI